MFNKKKFVLIFIIIFFVILALIISFLLSNKKDKGDTISETVPTIAGARGIKGSVEIGFEEDSKLPQKASLLKAGIPPQWGDEKIKNITESLGFFSEPIIVNDITDGKTYIYSDTQGSVTLYPESYYFRYSQNITPKPSVLLEEKEYISTAESFVNKLPLNKKYYFSFINYAQTEALAEKYIQTTKEQASVVMVNLTPYDQDNKIMIRFPDFSLATVYFSLDGSVTKAIVREIGDITPDAQDYLLKNLDQIKSSSSEFIFLTLDNQFQPNLESIKNTVLKTKIESIELVYLYEKSNPYLLQPVFLIKGKVTLKDNPEERSASFYLPAFAQ